MVFQGSFMVFGWFPWFLGPRGPHGIPMLVSPLVRLQEKPDHFYRGMYACICDPNFSCGRTD